MATGEGEGESLSYDVGGQRETFISRLLGAPSGRIATPRTPPRVLTSCISTHGRPMSRWP
ncbi:hypothetical protein FA95DRAFT_1557306 [Auriscalpium vulgare]|uniref:Uncharacterized protein n=1 Tax=Auriscalpium vulgare TaxID=40419 RepID=A0ACB8RXT6_9AGAM|nr:hypothetical protein FA95DRAFT_1557306 [Auriscalpium vulgare]